MFALNPRSAAFIQRHTISVVMFARLRPDLETWLHGHDLALVDFDHGDFIAAPIDGVARLAAAGFPIGDPYRS